MKTKITNNSDQRKAFLTAKGTVTVEIGNSIVVDDLVLDPKRKQELIKSGWTFEDPQTRSGKPKTAKSD